MRVTILGCGSSGGTPAIDWGWGECDPENPRNRRLRSSILIEDAGTRLLVDTSPDLRQQMLAAGLREVDAVLYTHAHADHLHGIDDLRAVNRSRQGPLDIYADADTLAIIETRFGYVLRPMDQAATVFYKPTLTPHTIADGDALRLGAVDVHVFAQDHGHSTSMGFRFGGVAYTTDLVELPETAFAVLEGVDVWIIGTLFDEPHPTHAHVDKALEWIERVRPGRAVLTHLSTFLDYATLAGRLPQGVEPAYDGMVLETDG
jgi:phosphoribosyl 1,2-cyclic phosphate phosphodiesterase